MKTQALSRLHSQVSAIDYTELKSGYVYFSKEKPKVFRPDDDKLDSLLDSVSGKGNRPSAILAGDEVVLVWMTETPKRSIAFSSLPDLISKLSYIVPILPGAKLMNPRSSDLWWFQTTKGFVAFCDS